MSKESSGSENNMLWIASAVLGGILLLTALTFIFSPELLAFSEQKEAGDEIVKDTYNAERAMQQYEEFREKWYEIKSVRRQIENFREEHTRFHRINGNDSSEWPPATRERHSNMHKNLVGLKNQYDRLVAEYNSMTEDATKAIFACGLPNNVDKRLYIMDTREGVQYTSQEARDRNPPEDPSECKYLQNPEKMNEGE